MYAGRDEDCKLEEVAPLLIVALHDDPEASEWRAEAVGGAAAEDRRSFAKKSDEDDLCLW